MNHICICNFINVHTSLSNNYISKQTWKISIYLILGNRFDLFNKMKKEKKPRKLYVLGTDM